MPISDTVLESADIPSVLPTPETKKYRVQLDFTAEDFQEINGLTQKLGLSTRAELFRSAIVALRWMYKKKAQNYTVAAVSPDRRVIAEPEFPFLERISPDATLVSQEADRLESLRNLGAGRSVPANAAGAFEAAG